MKTSYRTRLYIACSAIWSVVSSSQISEHTIRVFGELFLHPRKKNLYLCEQHYTHELSSFRTISSAINWCTRVRGWLSSTWNNLQSDRGRRKKESPIRLTHPKVPGNGFIEHIIDPLQNKEEKKKTLTRRVAGNQPALYRQRSIQWYS